MYKVIVADDEEIIRNGIERTLGGMEMFKVFPAENGEKTVALAKEQQVDAIVLDVAMPKLDGIGVMERLCSENIFPVVFVVSGYSEFSYAQQMLKFGVVDYILKPIDRADVIKLGERIIERLERKDREKARQSYYEYRSQMLSALMGTEQTLSNRGLEINRELEKLSEEVIMEARHDFASAERILDKGFEKINECPEHYRMFYWQHFSLLLISTLMRYVKNLEETVYVNHITDLIYTFRDEASLKRWLMGEIEQYVRIQNDSNKNYYYLQAKDYIKRHYTENIGVQDIAERLGITPNYLGRIFKEHEDCGILDYIKNTRLDYAFQLLSRSRLRIAEVARQAGIPDQRYFSKVFKERYGLSPKACRKSR